MRQQHVVIIAQVGPVAAASARQMQDLWSRLAELKEDEAYRLEKLAEQSRQARSPSDSLRYSRAASMAWDAATRSRVKADSWRA